MKSRARPLPLLAAVALLSGCGSLTPPKYENGEYVPPPAENPLQITLQDNLCGETGNRAVGAAVIGALAPVLVGQVYDRVINWLDAKQANLSVSSSGVSTQTFFTDNNVSLPKGCLVLKRADSLEAQFKMEPLQGGAYWRMVPYSLTFKRSEAKESPTQAKSIVTEVTFAAPGADGKLATFFQATFDLGKRVAAENAVWTVTTTANPFPGQDSGPFGVPKSPEAGGKKLNEYGVMKVTASIIEHGEGRDWIRGVTNALRATENREKILQPIVDAITGGTPKK